MALTSCPECANDVSDKATKCPKCGARLRKPKRGFFGFIFKWLFILFTLFMVFWLFSAISGTGEMMNETMTDAERAGAQIGTGIGFTMIVVLWAIGTVVFGALAYFTRGRD